MAKEFERKFLLALESIPIPKKHKKTWITQGYIFADMGKNIRVRLTKKKSFLCVKFTEGVITDEFEYKIPQEDALEIYEQCEWTLEKKRLSFKCGGVHFDIDTYPNGLVVVETEFDYLTDMLNWEKPSWIGVEVSGKSEYSNVVLAKQNLKF